MNNINNEKEPPVPTDFAKDKEPTLFATISRVAKGKHGFYAVAFSSSIKRTITFSLELLEEKIDLTPQVLQQLPGTSVVLSNIVSKIVKGKRVWRALSARFFKPSDEEVFASESQHQLTNERRSEHGH